MNKWMLNTFCVLAMTGFTAMAEAPADHGLSPVAPQTKPPVAVAPLPTNPAENKPARLAGLKDPCTFGRPTEDANIDNAWARILR